ncbi:MAG: DUF1553 domain-containing protein [Verrucomicrobia bacterium]|nr:DUF1553 domain-containing protein [Verrucomicrobiota bacterium]
MCPLLKPSPIHLKAARWLCFGLLLAGLSAIQLKAERLLTKIEVFPSSIKLLHSRDRQNVVVQAAYSDGVTRDVTAEALSSLGSSNIALIKDGRITPLGDGRTELKIQFEGNTVTVPLEIKDSTRDLPVSFRNDVMHVFMKAGCNAGSCHGAARGKDGFRLSLFGFDPDGDHHRITRELALRRVNMALPHESLMILKATGKSPHTGGTRIQEGDDDYNTLIRWLDAGAPPDPKGVISPTSLEILPQQAVLEGEGATQRTVVMASYSDGTRRDVTSLSLFMSNNETSASIDAHGRVKAGQQGEAFVMARFGPFTVGSQIIVIPKGLDYRWPGIPERNYIDTLTFNKHKKLRITPSELCTDDDFIRRAYVDITGQLPAPADFDQFMTNSSSDKRDRLVDELLGRKEFVELWVMKFSELLRIRSDGNQRMSYKTTLLYFNWLNEKFAANVPMDQIVRELLAASGGTFSNPASNFYQVEQETLKLSENVAQVFMGMRMQCAQCHNHPFDRWTMDDYYGFSAFFSQVGRKGAEDPRERIIFNSGEGEVKHPVGNRDVAPKFLGGASPDTRGKDRRAVLAEWLASPENPFFARNLVNIVWAHFMGKGIIEPVDDVRISNPPVNPELLDELARRFTEYRYDFKKLVADICKSRIYQLSTRPNESNKLDNRNFAKAEVRRMRAEVLLDVISQVTDTRNKFQGLPLGARAVQIADGNVNTYFLTTFGRAKRDTVCSCEVVMEPNLSQALHLLMGDTVNARIPEGGVVARLLKEGKTPTQVIEDLYVRCFSRRPTPAELEDLVKELPRDGSPQEALEDVFWSLLNAKEFAFNH